MPLLGATYDSISNNQSYNLLKNELYQAKRQLADAIKTAHNAKKEKMRVQYEKNLLEIQLGKVEEVTMQRRVEE